MIIQANAHIGFNCRNLDESVRFYENILGCKEKFSLYYGDMIPKEQERLEKMKPDELKSLEKIKDVRWIVYLEWLDGYFIELFNEVNASLENLSDSTKYGYTHFAIVVDDIEAFCQELVDKGAERNIDIFPQPSLDRNKVMWFHDPDGNKIEVHEYGRTAMQKVGREISKG
ncbi:MAG: VOC family protein [Lachnospiraceae bacterium]|nr:VOC family protein [Lachnospiraceae bacterium]